MLSFDHESLNLLCCPIWAQLELEAAGTKATSLQQAPEAQAVAPEHTMPNAETSVTSGGSIACNPGQKHTIKPPPQRAVFESISNSLNAVTAEKTDVICVAEFFPKCVHPLALTSDCPNICCKTLSNSYLDPKNYGTAINMGCTRGTKEGNDKQTVGNDMGIGMKESVFSLGGSLGYMSVDMTNEANVKVSGFVMDDEMMELRDRQGLTQQKELSYTTFEAEVKFENDKLKSRLLYPVKTAGDEMNDQLAAHNAVDPRTFFFLVYISNYFGKYSFQLTQWAHRQERKVGGQLQVLKLYMYAGYVGV